MCEWFVAVSAVRECGGVAGRAGQAAPRLAVEPVGQLGGAVGAGEASGVVDSAARALQPASHSRPTHPARPRLRLPVRLAIVPPALAPVEIVGEHITALGTDEAGRVVAAARSCDHRLPRQLRPTALAQLGRRVACLQRGPQLAGELVQLPVQIGVQLQLRPPGAGRLLVPTDRRARAGRADGRGRP